MATNKQDVGPDGLAKAAAVDPDGIAKGSAIEEDDVEGHSFPISPTITRDLSRAREADIERNARQQQQAREAKRIFRR